jgi:hypothetical protein
MINAEIADSIKTVLSGIKSERFHFGEEIAEQDRSDLINALGIPANTEIFGYIDADYLKDKKKRQALAFTSAGMYWKSQTIVKDDKTGRGTSGNLSYEELANFAVRVKAGLANDDISFYRDDIKNGSFQS